jgi:hypothetical protein
MNPAGVPLGGAQLPGQGFPSGLNAAQRAQGLGQGISQGLGQGLGQGLNLSSAAVRGAPTPQQAAAASLMMQQQQQRQQQQFGAAQQFAGGLGSLAGELLFCRFRLVGFRVSHRVQGSSASMAVCRRAGQSCR